MEESTHQETHAEEGHPSSTRDSRAFLRKTAEHLASLLETTEAQLEILTRELLPPLKEEIQLQEDSPLPLVNGNSDTETGNAHTAETAQSSPHTTTTGNDVSSASKTSPDTRTSLAPLIVDSTGSPPPSSGGRAASSASSATVASSVLKNRNAGSSANFLETNLQLAREYHQTCCSLSRMLHQEIENMAPIREGVCGNRVYNAVLQVENLQMLNQEKRNLALLRKALSEE